MCPHSRSTGNVPTSPDVAGTVAPVGTDWIAFFRWPSENWSALSWALLIPKLALVAVLFLVATLGILVLWSLPMVATFFALDWIGLPIVACLVATSAVFFVTAYFTADLLDL